MSTIHQVAICECSASHCLLNSFPLGIDDQLFCTNKAKNIVISHLVCFYTKGKQQTSAR